MIDKKVQEYSEQLKGLGVGHQIKEHPDLRTPAEVQGYLGLSLADGLSTMIMKADSQFMAVIRRDDCRLDFGKIKKVLGIKELRMANGKEFVEITSMPVGAARVYNPGLKTLLDKKLFEKELLTGGTGSFTCSFRYKSLDLRKLPNSEVVEITEVQKEMGGSKKRVFGGMRPSSKLHLGNYLGGAKGMIALQERNDFDCIFGVMVYHAITTPYKPPDLRVNIKEVVVDYLAAGLEPKKCHVMIQSDEHIILSYFLSTIYQVSRLEDLPTYKDKKIQFPEYVNLGLLYYPVLMAADILLYKAELVPVGIDQEPHLEVAREIARKFNAMFGETFPEPKRFDTPGRYVPSLLGEGKMSKSVEGSYISLTDDLETVKNKLAKAVTDSGKGEKFPETGPAANLVTLVELFEGHDRAQQYREEYKVSGIKYQVLKDELAKAIFEELEPIQERRKYFEAHPEVVDQILAQGKEYASKIARETLAEVREKMGLI